MRKVFSVLLVLTFFATSAQAQSFTYEPPASETAQVGESIVSIWELSNGNWDSRREVLISDKPNWTYATSENYLCPNEKIIAKEAPCDFANGDEYFFGSNILPVCASVADNFCVESLVFSSPSGSAKATHIGDAGGGTFDAIPSLGIEPGGHVSLWDVPGWTNSSGDSTYAVSVRSRQDWSHYEKRFKTVSLDLAVTPYKEVRGDYRAPEAREGKDVNGLNKVYGGVPQGCTWSDDGRCGKAADFVGNPEVKLVIRASNELSGWFRGRISETQIAISPHSSISNKIEISGKPVSVPRFHVYASTTNTPKAVQDVFPRGSGGTGRELFEGNSIKSVFSTGGLDTYTVLDGMRAAVNDTAAGTSTLWSIESIPLGNQPCFANASGVLGVVSTNATAYDGTAPGFEDGQLTYKVAGLHYAPDGKTLNLGTYDLVMRSDIARCLYGFTSAPVSAKIQVLTENGEAVVASTVVSEKNGWLNLAAYGFTFSEKNIRVQLTQAKPPVLKTTVAGFSSKATSLSSRQKQQVSNLASKVDFHTAVICTATYRTTAEKVLAGKRAASTCRLLQTLKPELRTSTRVAKASSSKQSNLVLVSIN